MRPSGPDPRDAQIGRLQKEKAKLDQELAKANSWWMSRRTADALGDDLRERGHRARVQFVTDEAIALLASRIGTGRRAGRSACRRPRVTWYRRHWIRPPQARSVPVLHAVRVQPRALARPCLAARSQQAGPTPSSRPCAP